MPEAFNEDQYRELPEQTRSLLEFMSVVWHPISVTELARLQVVRMEVKALGLLLRELRDSGWLLQTAASLYGCEPVVRDGLTRLLLREGRYAGCADLVLKLLSHVKRDQPHAHMYWNHPAAAMRDLRIFLLLGDDGMAGLVASNLRRSFGSKKSELQHVESQLWGDPMDPAWLPVLGDSTFLKLVAPACLKQAMTAPQDWTAVWRHLQLVDSSRAPQDAVWANLEVPVAWQLALRCDPADPWSGRPASPEDPRLVSWLLFDGLRALFRGDPAEAVVRYQAGIARFRQLNGTRKGGVGFPLDLLYILALLVKGDAASLKSAGVLLKPLREDHAEAAVLQAFLEMRATGRHETTAQCFYSMPSGTPLCSLVYLLVLHWAGTTASPPLIEQACDSFEKARKAGYFWLAGELADLIARTPPGVVPARDEYRRLSDELHEKTGCTPLAELIRSEAPWERALEALQRLGNGAAPAPAASAQGETKPERLVWHIERQQADPQDEVRYLPVAMIQKKTRTGWTFGRAVSLKRLATEREALPFLTELDLRLCQAIKLVNRGHHDRRFELTIDDAWPHLAEHPDVVWAGAPTTHLTIRQGSAELVISAEAGGELLIRLLPPLPKSREFTSGGFVVEEETSSQLKIYRITPEMLQLQQILGKDGLRVPKQAEAEVRRTLASLAPIIPVHSDVAGMDDASAVPPDARIHVFLLPWNDGLRLMMRVLPLGNAGPAFAPGVGRTAVLAEVDGRQVKTVRDLAQERAAAQNVIADCPALVAWEEVTEDHLLRVPGVCLEVLDQLKDLGSGVILSWPEGEKFRLTRHLDVHSMKLSISRAGEWFEVDGELRVNEDLVVPLRQLLKLSGQTSGRFLPLGDGQYLALTRMFRKQLALLGDCTEERGKSLLRFGAMAGVSLADLFDEFEDLSADSHWREFMKRIRSARDTEHVVPDGLQTRLRDYQADGFVWMMRLADWGAGGALADDMGLGKTVQALAVLVARAHLGPALVVAPLTVCNNWIEECARFAPSLRPIFYRGTSRRGLLEHLRPGDLVIASYGLMQSDAEAFHALRWSTAILDEAQAIKNVSARRTQAAFGLQADFRLITTGTPVENHLGELWSLFHFLNPGLLLSAAVFSERFQTPIERFGDEPARAHLKKLIAPFLLRRIKAQVLAELPSRTEIVHSVTLGDGERELYEALRRNAVEHLESLPETPGKHLQILAEITRLRLAACHPRLARPESELASSKLEAFAELVDELISNGHRALVFSQFVKHLELIRAYLDAHGIGYQYLDGSTPIEARKERVDAFQNGEGDLFLISLKAGGFGLNLTAADYVIHMDPWWNPAVEDQASDRAHRIGQSRPVTIYRLVVADTIEEKIVRLHQRKRELAQSLLEGGDLSGRLTAQDLLALIHGAQ